MVVDTSALIAILLLEPEAERFARTIAEARPRLPLGCQSFEAGIAIEGRLGVAAGGDLDDFVADIGSRSNRSPPYQVAIARRAYRTYGRGHHPAGLNFGDCFAYALAKTAGLPLLSKGDDFARRRSHLPLKRRASRRILLQVTVEHPARFPVRQVMTREARWPQQRSRQIAA